MIQFELREADGKTKVTDIPAEVVVDGSMLEETETDGIGSLEVGLESGLSAALAVEGRVIVWHGTEDASGPLSEPFVSVVESTVQTDAVPDSRSHVPLGIRVSGRSLLAQWEDVRVRQWPAMRLSSTRYYTRHFNFASPGKAAAAITGTAYDHGAVLDYDSAGQPNQPDRPPPDTWRASTAKRLWGRTFGLSVPTETCLLRRSWTTGSAEAIYRWHATADDRVTVWVGGVPVLKGADYPDVTWLDTWAASTILKPSTAYDLVLDCKNEFTAAGGSAAWAGFSAWALPFDGSRLTSDTLKFVSEATNWRALIVDDGDPTPGWTVPAVLGVLLGEWQAEKGLTNWEVVDMASTVGVAWESHPEINFETERTTGLGVLQALRDKGLAEFVARVKTSTGKKQLLCFPPGTIGDFHTGPASPPSFSVGDGELVGLVHEKMRLQP